MVNSNPETVSTDFDTSDHLFFEPLTYEDVMNVVEAEQPEVIALSFLSTTTYPPVKDLAKRLKMVAPNTPIILGGVFASMNSVHILKDCRYADCVGVGEGEELLPDYLNNLNNPGNVAGLVWRKGDEIIQNEPRPLIRDLNKFPYPDRESLPIDYIESLPLDVPAVLSLDKFCTVQTSRGCPYGCIYCDIPSLFGTIYEKKVKMLKSLNKRENFQ